MGSETGMVLTYIFKANHKLALRFFIQSMFFLSTDAMRQTSALPIQKNADQYDTKA